MANQRGPKPLPTNVHLINGNRSKKPLGQLLDGIRPDVEIPEPPDFLMAEAVDEWNRISAELLTLGIIAKIDRAALAVYCQAYARWAQAERKLKELNNNGEFKYIVDTTPSGYKQIGVWLQVSNRAVEQMHKVLAEFGMTPSARTRVSPSPQGDLFGYGSDGQKAGAKTPGRFFKD